MWQVRPTLRYFDTFSTDVRHRVQSSAGNVSDQTNVPMQDLRISNRFLNLCSKKFGKRDQGQVELFAGIFSR